MGMRMASEELTALRELEMECYRDITCFDNHRWLEGCRRIFGDRMPEVYGPPTRVIVVRAEESVQREAA
jgi:hypothetical protein